MSSNLVEEKIVFVTNEVRDTSFYEKQHSLTIEEEVDDFLDTILDFKKKLITKSERLSSLTLRLEEVSWFTDLNEESLKKLNDLIATAKDLRSALIRQYISVNFLKQRGIAKEEILFFKSAIDDFTETYKDLELVFFYLPRNNEFQKITKHLGTL